MINVYQFNSTAVKAVIDPDDNSEISKSLMGEDIVNVSFTSPVFIDFEIGDYATILANTYQINRPVEWTQSAVRDFEYKIVFEGLQYELTKAQYFTLNRNNQLTVGKFSLRAQPAEFCKLIVDNMDRWMPGSGWKIGKVITGDYQTLDFDGSNCLEALNKIAEAYSTEWFIEGRTIHLYQLQPNAKIVLQRGPRQALKTLTKSNSNETSNIVTRVYAYGSTKNIGEDYRNGLDRLVLPNNLSYLEKNVKKHGIFEKTIYFDGTGELEEVYPHRTGNVTAVSDPDTFQDNAINFDINDYRIAGAVAKLTFNTGQLAGLTFEILDFDFATKTFILKENTENQSVTYPNTSIKPAVGDQYVLTNIKMPPSYYTTAEALLLQKAQDWLNRFGGEQPVYSAECNTNFLKANAIWLSIGYIYNIVSAEANINVNKRLVSYKRKLRNIFQYSCEFADTAIPQPFIVKIINYTK